MAWSTSFPFRDPQKGYEIPCEPTSEKPQLSTQLFVKTARNGKFIGVEAANPQPGKLDESLVTIQGRTWFKTGDLATVDAEGYFFIKGRSKDMIIVGGENVYATEVEGVLLSHPGVLEAAVKGVPATGVRKALGELVQGYVVVRDPALTEKELRGYCFERMASFKVPVRILFLDALPRNPAGKVLKAELG